MTTKNFTKPVLFKVEFYVMAYVPDDLEDKSIHFAIEENSCAFTGMASGYWEKVVEDYKKRSICYGCHAEVSPPKIFAIGRKAINALNERSRTLLREYDRVCLEKK